MQEKKKKSLSYNLELTSYDQQVILKKTRDLTLISPYLSRALSKP
jgi:hypothetical protein